jgi:hypothetical protein
MACQSIWPSVRAAGLSVLSSTGALHTRCA